MNCFGKIAEDQKNTKSLYPIVNRHELLLGEHEQDLNRLCEDLDGVAEATEACLEANDVNMDKIKRLTARVRELEGLMEDVLSYCGMLDEEDEEDEE